MTKSQIQNYINKLHFRSYDKIYDSVKSKFPTATKELIESIIDEKWHDTLRNNKLYMVKIFSTRPRSYMMDLMDNGNNNSPRYWYLFININTRYAVAYPLQSKRAEELRQVLNEFINKYNPTKLTSDQESGINSPVTQEFIQKHKVSIQIVSEKNHSTLSIIDRFIRTLRDMNTPSDKSKHESNHKKYSFLSEKRMKKFLNIYNSTIHSSTGCTPEDMQNDADKEKEYIFKCLKSKERQEGIKDFKLKKGSFVYYLIPREHMKKRRYFKSRECYQIAEVKGNIYTIIAQDGNVKNLPRYRLILCNPDGSKPPNVKFASTFPGNWNGLIQKVVGFNKQTNHYRVIFTIPGNPRGWADVLPPSYLTKQDKLNVPIVTGNDSQWSTNYNHQHTH